MRIARFTYKGAYHHIISKGLNGNDIFLDDGDRVYFTHLLEEKAGLYGISVFSYTIMRNHYHLVMCNNTGRMSDMMRVLNGGFAMFFRRKYGGKGYVYQDRFHSTLIEDKKYAWSVIQYALINPTTAGICKDPFDYRWSSINCYFDEGESFVDTSLVESLFESQEDFRKAIDEYKYRKLDIQKSKFGYILGGSKFEGVIRQKFNRRELYSESRHAHMRRGREKKRAGNYKQKIMEIFMAHYKIGDLDDFTKRRSHESKRKADVLIVLLRDEAGMTYREISKELGLKFNSLGNRYKRAKKRRMPSKILTLLEGGT